MQNRKAVLISFCVAFFGFMMVFSYIRTKETALLELSNLNEIVFAAKNIPAGTKLDQSFLEKKKVPQKYTLPGALTDAALAEGRIVVVPVLQDTQILETMFVTEEGSGLASKVPKGQRGFSIAVSDVTAVGELVQPGDFVDVLATVQTGSFQEGQNVTEEIITKTILENIRVLAVNRISSKAEFLKSLSLNQKAEGSIFSKAEGEGAKEKLKTLSLAVSPLDAQKLALAQEIGSISVSLRSGWDKEVLGMGAQKATELIGITNKIIPGWRKTEPAYE